MLGGIAKIAKEWAHFPLFLPLSLILGSRGRCFAAVLDFGASWPFFAAVLVFGASWAFFPSSLCVFGA